LNYLPRNLVEEVEAIVPVPMSPEKERERGYNPSFLMAGELSDSLGIPVKPVLRKVRPTIAQRLLPRDKRLQNQKGAYEAVLAKPLVKIILVDDVFTTGATLEECAKVLKKSGVSWVGAVVWGRTPHHQCDEDHSL